MNLCRGLPFSGKTVLSDKNAKETLLLILAEPALLGQNPFSWARSPQQTFKLSLTDFFYLKTPTQIGPRICEIAECWNSSVIYEVVDMVR